jgi:DNA glycosylase AlkZ-like
MSALDAVEHLVGTQAQAPFAPHQGLWSRLDGFTGDELRKRLFAGNNGVFPGAVLVDGFVAGTWELVGKGEATSMRVQPYLDLDVVDDVIAEGNRLLELAFRAAAPRVEIYSLAPRLCTKWATARSSPRPA